MPHQEFDVVLAGSIIEHLSNPGLMLANIKRFFSENTILIITTPHVWGLLQFIRVAIKRNEAVNPEHTCWYSIPTLSSLLARYGYYPIEFNTGHGTYPDSLLWRIKKVLGSIFFRYFPHLGGSLFSVFVLENSDHKRSSEV